MDDLINSGLTITAIGMSVVFVLLTLLVWIIKGMSAIARFFEGEPEAPRVTPASTTEPEDEELIAVLSAAVSAYRHRSARA